MDLPSPCACCGAYSLPPGERTTILLAVCDTLVWKVLEQLGRYIVRAERSRYHVLGTRPYCEAHTMWCAPDAMVDKALRGAWDIVPIIVANHLPDGVNGDEVVGMLDEYVHDLAITSHAHTLYGEGGLAYRFQTRLGLPVHEAAWA